MKRTVDTMVEIIQNHQTHPKTHKKNINMQPENTHSLILTKGTSDFIPFLNMFHSNFTLKARHELAQGKTRKKARPCMHKDS